MQNKILTATAAYQLFLTCISSCIDSKEEGLKSGILQEHIPDSQSIPALIAISLWNYGYESHLSPSIMYSFLEYYAINEMSEDFLYSYQQYSLKVYGIEVYDDISNEQITALIDITDFAKKSKELGAKKHWGKFFKEPYKTLWNDVFNEKVNMNSTGWVSNFMSKLLKKW